MTSINRLRQAIGALTLVLGLLVGLSGCSISYGFKGGSIDYTRIRSITIADVANRAAVIYPTLAPTLSERLRDFYTSRTRLEQVPRGGDLELECTVTGYDLATMSVSQDNFADRTSFTVVLQVKYVNNENPKESFDRSFKAHRDFDRHTPFTQVQDALLDEIMEDLIKQVYNATIENW